MEITSTRSRKRGRIPGPKTDRYQVLLSPELAEWGKQQPGGLSGFLRQLLEDARSESPVSEGASIALPTKPESLLGIAIPRALDSVAEAVRASRNLVELRDDWDGEGSPGYSEVVWERASRFVLNNALKLWRENGRVIPPPAIYPGPDGSIDLLWESGESTLLVNVPPEADEPAKWFGSLKDGSETTKGMMGASETNLRLMIWLMELCVP